jgi:hypothetical protein
MRARRLRRQGIVELREAVAAGLVTTYRAGEIAKLPANEQEIAVAQWASRSRLRNEGQAIAATAIGGFLKGSTDKPINLDHLSEAIRDTIRRAPGAGAKESPLQS